MPHIRERHLTECLNKVKGFSPLIGVLGHRQVGKTTLLENIATSYASLDDQEEFNAATRDPKAYLRLHSTGWVALDECQNVPALFPALKEQVRITKQRPGLFLLSGSVRFTSKRAITESLTGRITNFDLLPLTISELESEPLPAFFLNGIGLRDFRHLQDSLGGSTKTFAHRKKRIETYLERGGLPGICFIREANVRNSRLDTQLQTILDRDLRMVVPTTLPFQVLRAVCQTLAAHQGEPLDYSALSRETGVSRPTLRKLIYGMESVFLIRLVPVEGSRTGYTLFFEDIAEARFLAGTGWNESFSLPHFLFTQSRAEFQYRIGESMSFFQYRTRGGMVPIALRTSKGILGVVPVFGSEPSRSDRSTAKSFLSHYRDASIIYAHWGPEVAAYSPRELLCPLVWMV